jgi:pyruvate ferredoxin oxidoreductase alpha subunit
MLMTEVIYASAGMRLPFVITGVNRTISAPISIQVDHQDAISLRDTGMIQIFVESVQEAYDAHIAAFKIAEDPGIMLPVMVCMDGWILTHSYEPVHFVDQSVIDSFLPPFKPENFLDVDNPKTWGSYAEEDVLMEFRYSIHKAMQYAKGRIKEIFGELTTLTGRDHGGLIESYRTEDADVILLAMGSVAGTVKESVDIMRSGGKKVGMVKLRCYRPFPYEDIWEVINGAGVVGIMDANFSMGSEGAVALDLKAKMFGRPGAPKVIDFIAGLGGKDLSIKSIEWMVEKAENVLHGDVPQIEPCWVNLNPAIVP